MAEARRHPRIKCEIPVRLVRAQGILELRSVDVSREGLMVLSDVKPRPREVIKLVVFPPKGPPIKAMALVARLIPGPPPGLGLQFFSLASEDRERWEEFLRELEPTLDEEKIFTPHRYPPAKSLYVLRPPNAGALLAFAEQDIKSGTLHLAAPDEPVDVGDRVNIFLVHPITEEEYELCGEVIRVTAAAGDRPEGIGVELVDQGPNLQDGLAKFVETGRAP